MTAKPTAAELGIDPDILPWRRSGAGEGAIEVAFAGDWVLMRVAGDPAGRVLVFNRNEWECFLDGARHGEFDDAAAPNDAAPLDDAAAPNHAAALHDAAPPEGVATPGDATTPNDATAPEGVATPHGTDTPQGMAAANGTAAP